MEIFESFMEVDLFSLSSFLLMIAEPENSYNKSIFSNQTKKLLSWIFIQVLMLPVDLNDKLYDGWACKKVSVLYYLKMVGEHTSEEITKYTKDAYSLNKYTS